MKSRVRAPGPRILDPAKLKERREQIHQSVTETARRASMKATHYARLESGRRTDPRLSTAAAIAAALYCSIDDLLEQRPKRGITPKSGNPNES